MAENTGGRGLNGIGELVGLRLEEGLALLDLVADLLEPLADGALRHGQTQLGHYDYFSHNNPPCI
jgi:hypothetical protein